jgi:N-acetylneuraminic acid mutarotase
MLTDMPTARGGASVQVIDGRAYVFGGMDAAGASMASMDVLDLATGTWTSGTPMATPRDNPGSAAIDGRLYVFGGRTRNAPTLPDVGTLATVEVYDPIGDLWTAAADMPTGRRAMSVVVVHDEVLVMGGESTAGGETFVANQAYDPATDTWDVLVDMPVGRHGAVAGRIGNGIYVAGGGTTAGTSFTDDVDVFRYR